MEKEKNALQTLEGLIRESGPLKVVRVSSAQARGRAKRYSYWGVVLYEIRPTKSGGHLTAAALGRAASERRSLRLAREDARAEAARLGVAVYHGNPGPVGELAAADLLRQLAAI